MVVSFGGRMSDEEVESVAMAECGACRAIIPIDSESCPECGTNFSGISEDALGECGACHSLVPLDSTSCPECGVLFVADDVVDILRKWVADTGINIRKLFDRFDDNNDGTIDSSELREGLLSLNLADLPPSQVDRLVAQIDADGNGLIDLDEFDTILSGTEAESADSTIEASEDSDTTEEVEEESEAEVPEEDDGAQEEVAQPTVEEEELVEDIDDEDFDLEDDDAEVNEEANDEVAATVSDTDDAVSDEVEEEVHPLAALAALMDEHEVSAQRMFNELDVDGNGSISLEELRTTLEKNYSDELDLDDVNALMDAVDDDGDGMIDITEFYDSMESLDDHDEAVEAHEPEKEFPTPWQKRMMSKSWNDAVWPILHVGFGILIALVLVNALFGPVDGSGGSIAYEPNDSGLIPGGGLVAGDIYACDENYQAGGCPNSLTPLAGENGASSMPKGFYWDGLLVLMFSTVGLIGSLFLHLVKAPEWRARVKAMKEFEGDKADATSELDERLTDESDDEMEDSEDTTDGEEEIEDVDHEDEMEDEASDDDADEEDAIDIGSHIGLVFDDEEVFGVIVEFDDEEETVTIEEDGTGDLVTGYQEDMFIE